MPSVNENQTLVHCQTHHENNISSNNLWACKNRL
jgi:hypothetical protein